MKGALALLLFTLVSMATSSFRQDLRDYYDEIEYLLDLEDAYYDEYYLTGDDRGGSPINYDSEPVYYYEYEYGGTGPGGNQPPPKEPKPPSRPTSPPSDNKPDEKPSESGPSVPVTFSSECGVNRYNNQRRSLDRRALTSLLRGMRDTDDIDMFKRIMAGKEAKRGAYPWISFFIIQHGDGGEAICGGSLISPEWIVSAGHCFFGMAEQGYPPMANQLDKLTVVLGEHDTNSKVNEETEQVFKPQKVIVHPNYNPHSSSEENDIALIKLPKPAVLNDYVKLVCMPDRPVPAGSKCFAAGWGKNHRGKTPEKLHDVQLVSITRETCGPHHPEKKLVAGMMCATHPPSKTMGDSCEGDSGGPLSCLVDGKFVLTGATSFGVDCAKGDKAPGVYTNIHHYMDWIKGTMSRN